MIRSSVTVAIGLLFVCLFLATVGGVSSSGTAKGQEYATLERYVWVPAGDGEQEIGYSPDLPGIETIGPEAFWVLPDGTVRILDSQKTRLINQGL